MSLVQLQDIRTKHTSQRYFYILAMNAGKSKFYKIPSHLLSTWAGPQAIPTMCLVSSPGSAAGSGLVTRKVSKCWHWSLLPQLWTSLSSVRARQWVEPAATSITFFPGRKEGCRYRFTPMTSVAIKIFTLGHSGQKAFNVNF